MSSWRHLMACSSAERAAVASAMTSSSSATLRLASSRHARCGRAGRLTAAGFTDLRVETLALSPPAVCILATRA